MKRLKPLRKRHGIFLADTMVGFAIAAVLALILVVGITKTHRARVRLNDNAAALRIAQRAMNDLRQGKTPAAADDTQIKVTDAPLGDAADATAPAHAWVQVTVHYRGRAASLVGLVPATRGAP